MGLTVVHSRSGSWLFLELHLRRVYALEGESSTKPSLQAGKQAGRHTFPLSGLPTSAGPLRSVCSVAWSESSFAGSSWDGAKAEGYLAHLMMSSADLLWATKTAESRCANHGDRWSYETTLCHQGPEYTRASYSWGCTFDQGPKGLSFWGQTFTEGSVS